MAVRDKKKLKPKKYVPSGDSESQGHRPDESRKARNRRIKREKEEKERKERSDFESAEESGTRGKKRRGGKGKNKGKKSKGKKSKNQLDLGKMKEETMDFFKKKKKALMFFLVVMVLLYLRFSEEAFAVIGGRNMEERDLYKILNSETSFTQRQIKKEYQKLVAQYHPDKNQNCDDCEERITEINKAYSVLKNKQKRKMYDQTKGVVDPIRSKSKSLTWQNFRGSVAEAGKPMLIQIYTETDKACQRFGGFWEEFMVEQSYMDYARINLTLEPKLANSFGFGVEEMPFVFSYVPGKEFEFFEFDEYREGSTIGQMRKFTRKVIGKTSTQITYKDFLQIDRQKSCIHVVFVKREFSPMVYEYMSLLYKDSVDLCFYSTKMGEHKRFYDHFKTDDLDYVLLFPESKYYSDNIQKLYIDEDAIEGGSASRGLGMRNKKRGDEEDGSAGSEEYEDDVQGDVKDSHSFKTPRNVLKHILFANYMKTLLFPSMNRFSFQDFCLKDFTAGGTEIALPVVSVLAITGLGLSTEEDTIHLLRQKQVEYSSRHLEQLHKSRNRANINVHRYQFGTIDLKENPQVKAQILDKSSVRKPKVLVYLSEMDQLMLLNDLDEVDDILEDCATGVIEDFKSIRDYVEDGETFDSLLKNENISFFSVFMYEIILIWKKALMAFGFLFVVNSFIIKSSSKMLFIGYFVLLGGFILSSVLLKLRKDMII